MLDLNVRANMFANSGILYLWLTNLQISDNCNSYVTIPQYGIIHNKYQCQIQHQDLHTFFNACFRQCKLTFKIILIFTYD